MLQQDKVLLNPTELPQEEIRPKEIQCNLVSDIQLWDRFKNGDEGAFIRIYNDYFEQLCDFGVQFANIHLVEDAIQDLFIDLRKKRENLPALKKSLRLFLFQCLKRKVFNMLKKQKKVHTGVVPEKMFELVPHHESYIILNQEYKEKLKKLDTALTDLSLKHREVIYYYFYQGMSYEEVQELMGFHDIKSARNLVYKIVKVLRKSFLLFF